MLSGRAMVAGAAIAIGGCGRIAFDPRADAAVPSDGEIDAAPDAGGCAAGLAGLDDNFDDGVKDPKWQQYAQPGVTIAEQAGTLHIVPPAGQAQEAYAGYVSACTFDLRTASVTVEIAQVPNLAGGVSFGMILDLGNLEVGFDSNGPQLNAYLDDLGGSRTNYHVDAFDQVQHRVLRLRGTGTTLVWETSPDGATFTPFHEMPPPFDLASVGVEVFGGTYQSVAAPGEIRFDNLRGN